MNRSCQKYVSLLVMGMLSSAVLAVPIATKTTDGDKAPKYVPLPSPDGKAAFEKATKDAETFKLASGLRVEPWAVEPQLANPVAFACDDKGRWYVAETFRFDDGTPYGGVYDIRQIYDRLDQDLACRTVEDRLAEAMRWNKGDLTRLTQTPDRVRRIEDSKGQGHADRSTVYATIHGAMTGLNAGVLPRGNDCYVTDIPDLLLFKDSKGNGVSDQCESLAYGFGVHYSLLGHDLHGLIWGPDGRIYFSNGDRGQHVVTKEGKVIDLPDCGAVFRCEPDGSNLEVFAYGLRNPQSLTFDKYGNLFTGDNNADYGEPARWEYIVEGGNHGWCIGYQHIRTPKSGGPWISEKLYGTPNENSAEFLIPPVAYVASGPSGNAYYPGVGLPAKYNDHFFQTDFRAGPSSMVHSFAMKPKGAGFEIVDHDVMISGPLTSDVKFGIDGGIYVLDWAGNGYQKASRGRIWHVTDPETQKDPAIAEMTKIIKAGMAQRSNAELAKLLEHVDMRVRQRAQFELALRGEKAIPTLAETLKSDTNQLARIHAIWGLAQIARTTKNNHVLDTALPLLNDKDDEIRAQVAKAAGDAKIATASNQLVRLLQDKSPRVRFFAAMSLSKVGGASAVAPILTMLDEAQDKDPYLRHAGSMALAEIARNNMLALLPAASHEGIGSKMGVLLALRHLERPEVARFLDAKEPNLVLEAARAIDDVPIKSAMPQLAAMINRKDVGKLHDFVVLRVLNANFRLGRASNANAVAKFVANNQASELMRVEALAMLGQWDKPRNVDRVVGVWRPFEPREQGLAAAAIKPQLASILLGNAPDGVRVAAIELAKQFGTNEPDVFYKVATTANVPPAVGSAALSALAANNDPRTDSVVELHLQRGGAMREQAIKFLARRNDAVTRLQDLLANGSTGDQQAVFATLSQLDGNAAAEKVIASWMDKLNASPSTFKPEIKLDLLEAAAKFDSEQIKSRLKKYTDIRAAAKNDPLAMFRDVMAGGDASLGKKIFFERQDVSCIRCHTISGTGGIAGPNLSDIATRHDRDYILRSIIDPNADIAPGFESAVVHLKSGHHYAGVVKADSQKELVLDAGDGAIIHIDKKEIQTRSKGQSPMPQNIAQPLSKRDLRNLVEFLSQQKQSPTQTAISK